MHVGFAANDCGVTTGAGFSVVYQRKQFAHQQRITPYVGPCYSNLEILPALEAKAEQVRFTELAEEELLATVVTELQTGKIVG